MFQALWTRLLPAGLPRHARHRVSLTIGFALVTGAMAAVFALVGLSSNPTASLVSLAFGLSILLGIPLLAQTQAWKLTPHLLLAATTAGIVIACQQKGGLLSSPAGWIPLGPFMAVLLMGNRQSLAWLLIDILLVVGLTLQVDPASWPAELDPPEVFAVSRVIVNLLAWGLAALFESARLRALEALETRRAETRMLVDAASQGFAAVLRDGRVGRETSAKFEAWLGERPASGHLADWVAQQDPLAGDWLDLALESLSEGLLPQEVAMQQLPKAIRCGERTLGLALEPMEDGRWLAILSDRSDEVARADAEAAQLQTAELIHHLRQDRGGVVSFVEEMEALLQALKAPGSRVEAMRALHTLKGSVGLYGLTRVAEAAHRLEDLCLELNRCPTEEEHRHLEGLWNEAIAPIQGWLGDNGLDIREEDLQRLEAQVRARVPYDALSEALASLRHEPASRSLERLARSAEALGARVGKPLECRVEADDVRVGSPEWSRFLSTLVHLLRNSVDHGIEPPEERAALGKPPTARVGLRLLQRPDGLHLEVEDDGRGIQWEKLEVKARAAGLPFSTHSDRVAAMFSDGLSTREEVSELSGRGVGTASVKAALERLEGQVTVRSAAGAGTCFTFTLPARSLKQAA
ncbi:MAG: ATP-binding protein [Myxococcota bacterium]|nr:ATP-binding protein [Myxococcota bacterium]